MSRLKANYTKDFLNGRKTENSSSFPLYVHFHHQAFFFFWFHNYFIALYIRHCCRKNWSFLSAAPLPHNICKCLRGHTLNTRLTFHLSLSSHAKHILCLSVQADFKTAHLTNDSFLKSRLKGKIQPVYVSKIRKRLLWPTFWEVLAGLIPTINHYYYYYLRFSIQKFQKCGKQVWQFLNTPKECSEQYILGSWNPKEHSVNLNSAHCNNLIFFNARNITWITNTKNPYLAYEEICLTHTMVCESSFHVLKAVVQLAARALGLTTKKRAVVCGRKLLWKWTDRTVKRQFLLLENGLFAFLQLLIAKISYVVSMKILTDHQWLV